MSTPPQTEQREPADHSLARVLSDEVERQRLIDLLEARWNASLVIVRAPGGYGKTRALSQAVRDNLDDPMGRDRYVPLRAAHTDLATLTTAVLAAIEPDQPTPDIDPHIEVAEASGRIIESLAATVPSRVAVILDDVHHLTPNSETSALLGSVISALPSNASIVLAGRTIPELPLARLIANDEVVQLGPTELAFTADETQTLTAQHGADVSDVDDLEGWPALVRLALVAGRSGSQDFLAQEVIGTLSPQVHRGLGVAVLAGTADAALFDRCGVDLTPERLAEVVPMVDLLDDGSVRPHDVWTEVSAEPWGDISTDQIVSEVSAWHTEAGRLDEAVMTAGAHHVWPATLAAITAALVGGGTAVSSDMTSRWRELLPESTNDEPARALLEGWHLRLTKGSGEGIDHLDRAIEGFAANGDIIGEAHAVYERAFQGWVTQDLNGLLTAMERVPRLIEHGATSLDPFVVSLEAGGADISGDVDRALELASTPHPAGTPALFEELRMRHLTTLRVGVGDLAGAVVTARELCELTDDARNRFLLGAVLFADGQIDEAVSLLDDVQYLEVGDSRDDFVHCAYTCIIGGSLGRVPEIARFEALPIGADRDRALAAWTHFAHDVLTGDLSGDALFSDRLDELAADQPQLVTRFRRFLVFAYVGNEASRNRFDDPDLDPPLAPRHLEQRALGRLLCALRSGTKPVWSTYPGHNIAVGSMPLPWTVELAAGLAVAGDERGGELIDVLGRLGGASVHDWLRVHAAGEGTAAEGARRLLAELPAAPDAALVVSTTGRLTVDLGAGPVESRRSRVRQLLSLLILRGTVDRNEAASLIWSDVEPSKARANLATALRQLRGELEPDRVGGESPFHVRVRGTTLVLHRSEHLAVDLDSMLDDDSDEPIRTWTDPVLPDLRHVTDLTAELHSIDARLADRAAAIALDDLACHRWDEAAALGERLVRHDEFDERSHRILIAALDEAGRRSEALHAAAQCHQALEELGVDPDPETQMLLRHRNLATTTEPTPTA